MEENETGEIHYSPSLITTSRSWSLDKLLLFGKNLIVISATQATRWLAANFLIVDNFIVTAPLNYRQGVGIPAHEHVDKILLTFPGHLASLCDTGRLVGIDDGSFFYFEQAKFH